MKNYLMVALILCAIPAVAVGQTVSCDECSHVASVYMGEGGFVATADDADMVTWVATCNGVTRSGELEAGDDGKVAALWTGDLACHGDEKSDFQIGPIMDGGWFWVTGDTSSAVGGFVANDVLDNATADITSAGDGVTMTAGKGAVFMEEASSGRIGILPNILPEPPATPLQKCGFKGAATATSPAAPVNTECALGDGKTTLLMTSQNAITGSTVRIMDKGSVTRPAGSGSAVILADLWGNGTGHYVTTHDATTANGISAMRGQPSVSMVSDAARTATRLTGVTYTVSLSTGGPGTGATIAAGGDGTGAAGGVSWVDTTANAATISVGSNTAYCSKDNNHSATVSIVALMTDAASAALVTPAVVRKAADPNLGMVGSASFTINCPAAAANQGQELVPENPFPISE